MYHTIWTEIFCLIYRLHVPYSLNRKYLHVYIRLPIICLEGCFLLNSFDELWYLLINFNLGWNFFCSIKIFCSVSFWMIICCVRWLCHRKCCSRPLRLWISCTCSVFWVQLFYKLWFCVNIRVALFLERNWRGSFFSILHLSFCLRLRKLHYVVLCFLLLVMTTCRRQHLKVDLLIIW